MTGKGGRTEGDLKQENQTRVWAGSKGGYKRHVSKLASASIMALTPCSLYCSRWPWSLITMCVCVCVRVWETQNSKCIPGTRWYVFVSVEVWYPIRSVHQGFYCVFFQVLLQWRWRTAPHASAFSTLLKMDFSVIDSVKVKQTMSSVVSITGFKRSGLLWAQRVVSGWLWLSRF